MWHSFLTVAAVSCYAVWLLLSLLVLIPKLRPSIRQWDAFCFVPEWKFFAPNPAQGDYLLLYRDRLKDASMTSWSEVTLAPGRRWWNLLWNPDKRANKALFDAILEVSSEANLRPSSLVGSVPYLTLLNFVSHVDRFSRPAFTQFLVLHSLQTEEKVETRLVFCSELHALEV